MENATNKNEHNLENTVNEKSGVVEQSVANNAEVSSTEEIKSEEKAPLEIVVLNQDGVKKGVITIIFGGIIGLVVAVVGGMMFGLQFLGLFIAFFAFFKGLQSISSGNKKVYKATCPYCKHEFGFPVKELSILCPQCRKRVIIKDNEFQIVE